MSWVHVEAVIPSSRTRCAWNTILLTFSRHSYSELIFCQDGRNLFSVNTVPPTLLPPPSPIHASTHMQHQDCIQVHRGGVPGSQRAGEWGLRSTQAGVRYPCAFTLGSVRPSSFPWLPRGQLTARPLLPPSKTSHATFFSCYSLPGAEPRGQDTAHIPHRPTENTALITSASGLPSTHRGLRRVWPGLDRAAGSCKPLCFQHSWSQWRNTQKAWESREQSRGGWDAGMGRRKNIRGKKEKLMCHIQTF